MKLAPIFYGGFKLNLLRRDNRRRSQCVSSRVNGKYISDRAVTGEDPEALEVSTSMRRDTSCTSCLSRTDKVRYDQSSVDLEQPS